MSDEVLKARLWNAIVDAFNEAPEWHNGQLHPADVHAAVLKVLERADVVNRAEPHKNVYFGVDRDDEFLAGAIEWQDRMKDPRRLP